MTNIWERLWELVLDCASGNDVPRIEVTDDQDSVKIIYSDGSYSWHYWDGRDWQFGEPL